VAKISCPMLISKEHLHMMALSYLIHHPMTVGFRSKKIIYVQDDDLMFSSYYFVKGNLVIEEFVDVNVVDQ